MTALVKLRQLRFEQTRVAYQLGELKEKIKLNPGRTDLKSIRVKRIAQLRALNAEHESLMPTIRASPYSRTDVVDLINKLAEIEATIAHRGTEEGHRAIRAYIEWLTQDADRLEKLGAS